MKVQERGRDRLSALPHSKIQTENIALIIAGIGALAGLLSALLTIRSAEIPLSGLRSLGTLVALTSAVTGAGVFLYGYLRLVRSKPELVPVGKWKGLRSVLNTASLTLTAAFVALLVIIFSFEVMQLAFVGLQVQASSAYVISALVSSITAYMLFNLASSMSTQTVSTLLTLFLLGGVLSSMITSSTPDWWQQNFSFLGSTNSLSSATFNITVILSGIVVTTMADFLTRDLYRLLVEAQIPNPERRVTIIRTLMMVIGVSFMIVGLVPVDVVLILHNIGAQGLFAGFMILVVVVPFVARVFSKTFIAVSIVFFALTIISVLLFFPFGYYNLTGLELIALGLVFVWLILFVRTISAMLPEDDHS